MTNKMRFSKEQALVYLQQIDGQETSLNELKTKWGWDNHVQVLRYLVRLEKQKIIIKIKSKNGTRVYFQPSCIIV